MTMDKIKLTLQFALLLAVLTGQAAWSDDRRFEITHFWKEQSEREALDIIKNEFIKRHAVDWVEIIYPSFEDQRVVTLKRIVQGYPPDVVQWHPSGELRKLQEMQVLNNVDTSSIKLDPDHKIPKIITDLVSDNGRFIVLPISIHGENWIWFNKKIYTRLKLDYPKSWDELIEQARLIRAAGYAPVAIGRDVWNRRLLYTVILNSLSKEAYLELMFEGDPNAADRPEVKQAFEIMAELRALSSNGDNDATWVDAVRMVANEKAAMTVMGDWANKEFRSLGLKPGIDYECRLPPAKEKTLMIVVDAFVFPKNPKSPNSNIHNLFSEVVLDPKIQQSYTLKKGSLPVVQGIPFSAYDTCSQIGMKMLNGDESKLVLSTSSITVLDNGAIVEALSDEFWNTKMTPDEVIKQLKHDLQAATLSIVF
jgi:glucose/mannose transport system substrate-binding protein